MLNKHIFNFLIVIFLFLVLPVVSYAKDATTSGENRGRKEAAQKLIQQRKDEFEERKASIEAKTEALRKERVILFWSHSENKLLGMIERINKLIERIDLRIDKISTEDPSKDLSSVKTDVQKAKSLLADAKTKIESIDTNLNTVLSTQNSKNAFKTEIANIKGIRTDLKEIHKILTHVVGQLKGLRAGTLKVTKTPAASTTLTVTPTAAMTPTVTLTVTPTPE